MTIQSTGKAGFTLVEIMTVIGIIALLVAIAVPTYIRIRASAQDKAVLNNVRLIHNGANRYYLESGVSEVPLTSLVGTGSDAFVTIFPTVANEVYPSLLTADTPITITNVGSLRTITYNP